MSNNSNPTFVNDMNLFGNHIKQIPCIVGEGSPTESTYGAVGMLYMDSSSDNGEMYKCVKVEDDKYTWEKLVSEDNGEKQDYTTLTNKPKINGVTLEGNKTAEELGIGQPSDEQVSNAVKGYLTEHPVTSGATEEEAKTIKLVENIGFSDPYDYGNLLDVDTMMLNNTGTPADGRNVFELTPNWDQTKPWQFLFFPVEAGGVYTLASAKLPTSSEFRAVSRDGVVLAARPSVAKNPAYAVGADSNWNVQYQTLTVGDGWPADGYYLMLQLNYGTDMTDFDTLMVFRGEHSVYQGYVAYDPNLGTTYTPRLRVTDQNLTDDLRDKLNRGNTAIQAEDMESSPYEWNVLCNFESYPAPRLDDWVIGEVQRMFNSARIAGADLDTQIRLGDYYAHCPTMEIIGDTAYVVAFQNTKSTADNLEQTTIELWRVDLANWTVMEQLNVATAGLTCGDDTLAIGGIDPNMLNINNETLRIVFTTRLTDGANRICYRDYDLASGALGEVGVCKIANGTDAYDFDIAGIKAVCGTFTAANPVINMATQYATHNEEHYIGLGVDAVYSNIPILKTTDFITFSYWATPSVDGNNAHYECACAVVKDNGTANLYTSTRQTGDSKATLLNMVVDLADGSVKSWSSIPSGNARPFWYVRSQTSAYDYVFLFHVNQHPQIRQTSTITDIKRGGTLADTVAMIYPCVREHNGELVVAYMRNTASLHMSRIPKLPLYSFRDVIPILNKMLDYFGDGTK